MKTSELKKALEFIGFRLRDEERNDMNEDKKYCLQYRWFSCSSAKFLCYDKMIKGYYLRDFPKPTEHASCLKMLFTKQEIESIKERFSTILDDYEILEVEDENEWTYW